MPDKKGGLASSSIDTQFIAANNNPVITEGMDNNLLMRYRFLEILARIAKAKFYEFNKTETIAEAVEKLLTEVIFENYQDEPW